MSEFGLWAVTKHKEANHFYDENLPYDYHLELSYKMGLRFKHLLTPQQWFWVKDALYGHDLIEDVRQTYNDVYTAAIMAVHTEKNAKKIAESVRAVTNYGRGRNREERMPDYIYKEIVDTECATYIKICDRLANVKHGLISESSMRKKYLKENTHFKEMLYTEAYDEMWVYLEKLLTIEI
ncbi:MAG: phosphohydrolase [Bacteroidia bacterium]